MYILDVCIMYYFDRCLIFIGTCDRTGDPYPCGYGHGYGVNPYPLVNMSDSTGLFFCRGYGYGIVIPGRYLPIAISNNIDWKGKKGNK
jgi:hypothetical protein